MEKIKFIFLCLFLHLFLISLVFAQENVKFFKHTKISGGYQVGLILRKQEKNFAEGSNWYIGFPLNNYLYTDFDLSYLKLKESPNGFKNFLWEGKILISLAPKKKVNPFFILGITENIVKTKLQDENGAGIITGIGVEIVLNKYAFIHIYSAYFKQSLYKDEGGKGGCLIGSCYKAFCIYFKSTYISKTQLWQDSEFFLLEAGVMLKFSVKNTLKKIENILKDPYFP